MSALTNTGIGMVTVSVPVVEGTTLNVVMQHPSPLTVEAASATSLDITHCGLHL